MMQNLPTSARLFVVGSFVVACSVKVETLPSYGQTLAAQAFSVEAGGKGFNLAVAARRLGAEVDGLFAIGDDRLGQFLAAAAFDDCGLARSMIAVTSGRTGGGVGFISADGETCLAVHSGANALLSASHLDARADAVRQADIVLAQFETSDASIFRAFEIARHAGRRTLLNPSPFRASCLDLLPLTSVLCVNAVEAEALATLLGIDDQSQLAEAVFDKGAEALVVTSGAQGATAHLRSSGPVVQPSFPVTAIDTLGAGDAFAAALAVALAEGAGWPDAMRRAAAGGALTCCSFGVLDALPTRAAVDAMVRI